MENVEVFPVDATATPKAGDIVLVEEARNPGSPWAAAAWLGEVKRINEDGSSNVRPLYPDKIVWVFGSRVIGKPDAEYMNNGLYLTKDDKLTVVSGAATKKD